jgi:hypothetical protein
LEDDKKAFFKGKKESSSKDYEDEVRNSLSCKDHIIPHNGVTFIEPEYAKTKKSDQSNSFIKKGSDYNATFMKTNMSMN